MSRRNKISWTLWMFLFTYAALLQAQPAPPSTCSSCTFSNNIFQCQCLMPGGKTQQTTSFDMANCATNSLMNVNGSLACWTTVNVTCMKGQATPSVSPETITVGKGLNVIIFSLAPGSTSGATISSLNPPVNSAFLVLTGTGVGNQGQQVLQDNNPPHIGNSSFSYTVYCTFPDGTITRKDPTIVNQGTQGPEDVRRQ